MIEGIKTLQVFFDLVHWKFDKHTGNLWGLVNSDDLLNVVVNQMANLFFQVWVSLLDGWDELNGFGLEHLGVTRLSLHLWWCHHSWLLHSWHHLWLLLNSWHWHLLSWHCLRHTSSSWLWHSLVHLVWIASFLLLIWELSSVLRSSHVVSVVLLRSFVLLHQLEELLDDLGQVWLTLKIIPLEPSGLLLSVLFKISLVLELIHLDFSNLFDFIVVDNQHLTVIHLVRKLLLSLSAGIWLLVAYEGILISSCSFL